ncbi:4505_t:CDS:2 [Ambispora gerdemannii]|uniref:4505_t:CDS:1 n=1 Tax=Ambispora gerdemannii TaxID=144530 RepID=A0A9N9D586_9GLOM|nr:4505_t:CDS:2 [Ambispora gerdemannii]
MPACPSEEHSPNYLEKIFSTYKVIYVTAETFIRNQSFTTILRRLAERNLLLFVIEVRIRSTEESYVRNCRTFDLSRKWLHIIYCSTICACEETLADLYEKGIAKTMGVYHEKLNGKASAQQMKEWKKGLIQGMIATNAFVLGINSRTFD